VAVVTNIKPNHLDRHGTLDEYAEAKKNIVANQNAADFALLNANDSMLRSWSDEVESTCLWFGGNAQPAQGSFLAGSEIHLRFNGRESTVADSSVFRLPGPHNIENALAAVCACAAVGVEPPAMAQALAEFTGIEHRMEFVCERGGVSFYNDSKATTPEAAMAALDSFDGRIVLIAGGSDKKVSLDGFADKMFQKADSVVLLGETADAISRRLDSFSRSGFRWVKADSFADAVSKATAMARPGDVVLLSPGCASYDMFENYEQRGREFKKMVMGGS